MALLRILDDNIPADQLIESKHRVRLGMRVACTPCAKDLGFVFSGAPGKFRAGLGDITQSLAGRRGWQERWARENGSGTHLRRGLRSDPALGNPISPSAPAKIDTGVTRAMQVRCGRITRRPWIPVRLRMTDRPTDKTRKHWGRAPGMRSIGRVLPAGDKLVLP